LQAAEDKQVLKNEQAANEVPIRRSPEEENVARLRSLTPQRGGLIPEQAS
jgi:hypothetical protein